MKLSALTPHRPFALTGAQVLRHGADAPRLLTVLVEGGAISALLEPGAPLPPDAQQIDLTGRLLVPGLVNAHTHAHGGLGRGAVADRVPLEGLLAMGPAVNGNRRLDDLALSTRLSAAEMIRRGCTACFDMPGELPVPSVEGVLAVAGAYRDTGMRAVVAPMAADLTLWQAYPDLVAGLPAHLQAGVAAARAPRAQDILQAYAAVLRDWPFDRAFVRPALGPTIPLHCTDDFFVACDRLAREHGVRVQSHVAESQLQALFGRRRYGRSIVEHLGALGVLGPHLSLAHAIWISDTDMDLLAAAGCAVAHNPLSNLRLGSGVAAVRRMLDRGIAVGVGTDSANTSDTQNLFEAMRLAAYLSRVQGADWTRWISAPEAFTLATAGSARVLGFDGLIGELSPGYRADIVVLRTDDITYVPAHDLLLQMVNGESGTAIESVLVDGRALLDEGVLTTIDEPRLRSEAAEAAARLGSANAQAAAFARELLPHVGAFCSAHGETPVGVRRRFARDD